MSTKKQPPAGEAARPSDVPYGTLAARAALTPQVASIVYEKCRPFIRFDNSGTEMIGPAEFSDVVVDVLNSTPGAAVAVATQRALSDAYNREARRIDEGRERLKRQLGYTGP